MTAEEEEFLIKILWTCNALITVKRHPRANRVMRPSVPGGRSMALGFLPETRPGRRARRLAAQTDSLPSAVLACSFSPGAGHVRIKSLQFRIPTGFCKVPAHPTTDGTKPQCWGGPQLGGSHLLGSWCSNWAARRNHLEAVKTLVAVSALGPDCVCCGRGPGGRVFKAPGDSPVQPSVEP